MREDYQHELIPGPDIDFNEIRDLFDPMLWDVGYLNDTGFQRASAAPVNLAALKLPKSIALPVVEIVQ